MSQTVELPRVGGPGSGLGELWRVVVLNDEHNTFDHVAETLARVIPGVSLAQGYRLADQIHKTGLAIVWRGPRDEVAVVVTVERIELATVRARLGGQRHRRHHEDERHERGRVAPGTLRGEERAKARRARHRTRRGP